MALPASKVKVSEVRWQIVDERAGVAAVYSANRALAVAQELLKVTAMLAQPEDLWPLCTTVLLTAHFLIVQSGCSASKLGPGARMGNFCFAA